MTDYPERELLEKYIIASTKSIDDPTVENTAAVEALWEQITASQNQTDPIDWDAMNEVADWVVELRSFFNKTPQTLKRDAISAGKQYLQDPTAENEAEVYRLLDRVIVTKLVAELELYLFQDMLNPKSVPTDVAHQLVDAGKTYLGEPSDENKARFERLRKEAEVLYRDWLQDERDRDAAFRKAEDNRESVHNVLSATRFKSLERRRRRAQDTEPKDEPK